MSPRRKIRRDETPLLVAQAVKPARWRLRRLPVMFAVAGLAMVEAIAACVLILAAHESQRRAMIREAAVLDDVRAFMAIYTSPDPFHANDYVDRVLEHAVGDFAQEYRAKANEALAQVARAEPTTGTVLAAGLQRWNDDGGANVIVATRIAAKTPDGKQIIQASARWLVTAKQEGDQWKISNLSQVI